MGVMQWDARRLAVAGLGLALVVFFAGATAAIAAGADPPGALWAAGGGVSGGLLGLLAPSPVPSAVRRAAIKSKKLSVAPVENVAAAPAVQGQAANVAATPAADGQAVDAAVSAISWSIFGLLAVVFVALLALAILLAGGAIRPPSAFAQPLDNVTKAVLALASAAGTGVLGLLVPKAPAG
jgi:hypothetical protein